MNKLNVTNSTVVFNVEKIKNQKVPDHFFASKDAKSINVNGVKVKFMRNAERTQYVAFEIDEVKYYIRDHSVMNHKSLQTFIKPVKEIPVKKEKVLKTLVSAEQNAIMSA